MTTQYRMSDSAAAPQTVKIHWEMILETDDSVYSPDEHDEGFWPSRDPESAGYVDPGKFDEQQDLARARMQAFRCGDWWYVGVIARAVMAVPAGAGCFTTYTLDSPGLWGIESDSGEYIKEVFEEQKAELLAALKIMGKHFT